MPKIRNLGTKVTLTCVSLALLLTIYIAVRVNPLGHTASAATQTANTSSIQGTTQTTSNDPGVSGPDSSSQSQPSIQQQPTTQQQLPMQRVSRGS